MGSALSASRVDPDQDIRDLVDAGQLERALRLLMERHGPAVYRYCCSSLRQRALADDVHQRVFIEAHRDIRQFGGRSTLRTWLFVIARNRMLDAAKRERRHHLVPLEEQTSPDFEDSRPGADDQIDDMRLREALAACVKELSAPARTALLLHYQQGFSFEEMAEVCHEKAGTLRARVARALPALRRCIEMRTGGAV